MQFDYLAPSRRKIGKHYSREVQAFCKTSGFRSIKSNQPRNLDWALTKSIVSQTKEKSTLMTSVILSVSLLTTLTPSIFHLTFMKLVAILVIMCKSAYQNNSNYFPFFVIIYLYSTNTHVDAITLFNHLSLFILYNIFLKTPRNIKALSTIFIKQQASNSNLVGKWNNLEYRENVVDKRMGNTVKFKFKTIVLWIKSGWRISNDNFKH